MSELYASIAAQARLEVLKLVHSTFDLSSGYSQQEPLALEIKTRWLQQLHDADAGAITGICEWGFRCLAEADATARLVVVGRYLVQYSGVGPEADVAAHFLRDVGRMAAYPYFRAHVATMTCAASVVLPPLPTINIGTFRKQDTLTGALSGQSEGPDDVLPDPKALAALDHANDLDDEA